MGSRRERGAGLSLDDFGTGYSSLAYLQRFLFDMIKIDPSFVHQNGNGTRPVVLRSSVTLTLDLAMEVSPKARKQNPARSSSIGSRQTAQGYAFGYPLCCH